MQNLDDNGLIEIIREYKRYSDMLISTNRQNKCFQILYELEYSYKGLDTFMIGQMKSHLEIHMLKKAK